MSAVTADVQTENWGLEALKVSRLRRRQHQDVVAGTRDKWVKSNRYFYARLARLLRLIVEPGKRVLEVRCQTGHLLNSVNPAYGVGVDISEKLVSLAEKNFPNLRFVCADPEDLALGEKFDYVVFSHVFRHGRSPHDFSAGPATLHAGNPAHYHQLQSLMAACR